MYKSDVAKETKQFTDKIRQLRSRHAELMEGGYEELALEITGEIKDQEKRLATMRDEWDRDKSPVVNADDIA